MRTQGDDRLPLVAYAQSEQDFPLGVGGVCLLDNQDSLLREWGNQRGTGRLVREIDKGAGGVGVNPKTTHHPLPWVGGVLDPPTHSPLFRRGPAIGTYPLPPATTVFPYKPGEGRRGGG